MHLVFYLKMGIKNRKFFYFWIMCRRNRRVLPFFPLPPPQSSRNREGGERGEDIVERAASVLTSGICICRCAQYFPPHLNILVSPRQDAVAGGRFRQHAGDRILLAY